MKRRGTYEDIIEAALTSGEWSERFADADEARRAACGIRMRKRMGNYDVMIFQRGAEVYVVVPGAKVTSIPACVPRRTEYQTDNTRAVAALLETGADTAFLEATNAEDAFKKYNAIHTHCQRHGFPISVTIRGNGVLLRSK